MGSGRNQHSRPAKAPPGDLSRIRFTVGGEVALDGADTNDPGTMDWWGTASISEWPFDDEDEDALDPEKLTSSGFALSTDELGGGGLKMTVLQAHGLIIDLWSVQDIYAALDARSQDYAGFIPMFGEQGEYGEVELAEELEESLVDGGNQVVILDRVRLAPAWRGCGGIGRLLTIRLLHWVCDGPRAIALKPFPIDLNKEQKKDKATLDKAMAAVRRTWTSIGFEPFTDNIWILDTHTGNYQRTTEKLSEQFGLHI